RRFWRRPLVLRRRRLSDRRRTSVASGSPIIGCGSALHSAPLTPTGHRFRGPAGPVLVLRHHGVVAARVLVLSAALATLAHGNPRRRDRRARAHALQPIHHDRFALLQPVADDPQPVNDRPQLHRPVLDLVIRADNEYVLHALVRSDRAVVDEQSVVFVPPQQLDAREQSGRENAVVVIKLRPPTNGPRRRIELVIDEYHHTLMRVPVLIGQP